MIIFHFFVIILCYIDRDFFEKEENLLKSKNKFFRKTKAMNQKLAKVSEKLLKKKQGKAYAGL